MPRQHKLIIGGVTFYFAYDPLDPSMLHIFARHLKTPQDAIRAWLGGQAAWNEAHARFHSHYQGIEVTWFWINERRRMVQVISCYDAE